MLIGYMRVSKADGSQVLGTMTKCGVPTTELVDGGKLTG